jgi:hypothetical protein
MKEIKMLNILQWLYQGNEVYPRHYLMWSSLKSLLINSIENPIASKTYAAGITNVKPIEEIELEDMFDLNDLK